MTKMINDSRNSPVRVKICGITSVEDALVAVSAGADAIGLVFYPESPRYVTVATATKIAASVGPFVTVVGLFVDATSAEVERVVESVSLHLLQFHGNETVEFCESFQRPYLKALRMRPELDLQGAMSRYGSAAGILLDAYRKGVPGGTGETFDWRRVPSQSEQAVVLAGGLTPENIIDALAATRVYGVDVSGGVESLPGKKDPTKVVNFIRRVKTGLI